MKFIVCDDPKVCGAGVARKVMEQILTFEKMGVNCLLYQMPIDKSFISKIKRVLPFFNVHKLWKISDFKNDHYIYIRRGWLWDRYYVQFLKNLKEVNKNVKIVYEIPTYPYDSEMFKSCKGWPFLLKDKWYRRHIHKFVDRIATLTDDKEIFGVPTLKISNGIDVDKIRPRQVRDIDVVHAIAVANFEFWHGYDRFLEGMKTYYAGNPSRRVIFHLVGRGGEFERYQKMVADYGLDEYVIFHNKQTGEALDAIYDQCNLGIASLGCYRKGLYETQELKSREYLAKGLPFVTSVKITDIPDGNIEDIYLQVPNNDSPINIENVLDFYDKVYSEGPDQVNTRLRQFAKEHFSMEVAMKEVIEFFKNS